MQRVSAVLATKIEPKALDFALEITALEDSDMATRGVVVLPAQAPAVLGPGPGHTDTELATRL